MRTSFWISVLLLWVAGALWAFCLLADVLVCPEHALIVLHRKRHRLLNKQWRDTLEKKDQTQLRWVEAEMNKHELFLHRDEINRGERVLACLERCIQTLNWIPIKVPHAK